MWRRVRLVLSDWDDTITARDTLALVADAGYSTQPGFPRPWSHYGQVYQQQLEAYNRAFRKDPEALPIANHERYQQGVRPVERSGVDAALADGLFQRVTVADLQQQAVHVEVKAGFWDAHHHLSTKEVPLRVISVNTTLVIMRRCFEKMGRAVECHSNELEFGSDGYATGRWDPHTREMRSGSDKQEVVRAMVAAQTDGAVVYVGDSATDVLAMLEADVGIIIGDGTAHATATQLGVAVVPLAHGPQPGPCVYHAHSWAEIASIVE